MVTPRDPGSRVRRARYRFNLNGKKKRTRLRKRQDLSNVINFRILWLRMKSSSTKDASLYCKMSLIGYNIVIETDTFDSSVKKYP